MKTLAIGFSTAALMLAGTAFAAPGNTRPKADADGNGTLTRAEAQAHATAAFARLDYNRDGKLDRADREARQEARRAAMFDRLDTNKDGQISKAEFMAPREGGERAAAGERGHDGEHRGRHGKGRWGARHHGGMMGGPGAYANGDRTMTQAEFVAAALKRFDDADANKDGQVTREERQAAHQRMNAQWQQKRAQKAQD